MLLCSPLRGMFIDVTVYFCHCGTLQFFVLHALVVYFKLLELWDLVRSRLPRTHACIAPWRSLVHFQLRNQIHRVSPLSYLFLRETFRQYIRVIVFRFVYLLRISLNMSWIVWLINSCIVNSSLIVVKFFVVLQVKYFISPQSLPNHLNVIVFNHWWVLQMLWQVVVSHIHLDRGRWLLRSQCEAFRTR